MTNILEIKKEVLVIALREERGENFDIGEVNQSCSFCSDVFEVGYNEYLVVTEEEREDYHRERFESLVDEMGLYSFSADFQETILRNFVLGDFFEEVVRENFERYIYDMDEKEYAVYYEDTDKDDIVDTLTHNVGDFREYCLQEYGQAWVDSCITCGSLSIDWEKVRELCIEVDGYANLLSSYDGEELEIFISELQEILYIYRQS